MSFRFLHIADIHLDTPFKSKDLYMRTFLRDSIRQAFESCIDLALSEKVHAVLIAGDLFDGHTFSFTTEKFLIKQAERLNEAKIRMFYTPGNHDPSIGMHKNRKIEWPENVHVFATMKPEVFTITDADGNAIAAICGAGHENEREHRNVVSQFPDAKRGIPFIGLVHTMVHGASGYGGHEVYAPCTLEDMRGRGYAYWALGHIHKSGILEEEPLVIYPGNLLGRNFSEDGRKGAYLVEIGGDGKARAEFMELAPVNWVTFTVDGIGDCADVGSLEDRIHKSVISTLGRLNYSGQIVSRIELRGPSPLFNELQKEEQLQTLEEDLKELLSFRYLEISTSQVVKSIEPDKYRNGPHILGTALSIYDRLKTDDEFLFNILKDEKIAGISPGASLQDKAEYLHSLLYGLDYEITDRITGGVDK